MDTLTDWKEVQEYWQKNKITQEYIVQSLIEANIIKDSELIWSRLDKDYTNDDDFYRFSSKLFSDYDYVDFYHKYWRYADEENLFTFFQDLLSLADIKIEQIDNSTDYIQLQKTVKQPIYQDSESYFFTHNDKHYQLVTYHCYSDYDGYNLASLANIFLEIINSPKRLFIAYDQIYRAGEDVLFIALDYQTFLEVNKKLQLPVPLVSWEEYGFAPLDYLEVTLPVHDKLQKIMNNGYYLTVNNQKVTLLEEGSVLSREANTWLFKQAPHLLAMLEEEKLRLIDDDKLSEHSKLTSLWTYAIELRNLFVAITRNAIYDKYRVNSLYIKCPLWNEQKSNQLSEEYIAKMNIVDLDTCLEVIKEAVFTDIHLDILYCSKSNISFFEITDTEVLNL